MKYRAPITIWIDQTEKSRIWYAKVVKWFLNIDNIKLNDALIHLLVEEPLEFGINLASNFGSIGRHSCLSIIARKQLCRHRMEHEIR